jgi:hypothetical protein
MAQQTPVTPGTDVPGVTKPPTRAQPAAPGVEAGVGEPSLGDLFKELAQESSTLIKQEVALAKSEMQENLRDLGKDAAMMAAGGAALLLAMLVFTAFLIAGLGDMLGDEYWLGALIVGVTYALVGGVLLMRGRSGVRRDDLKPEQTIRSLQDDKRWAQAEAQQVKRDLRT